jgi:hypothetical protein
VKRQNRGQIRIIEAFLAVMIVFSSFAIFSNLNVTQGVKKSEDLASIGLQTLMTMDSNGNLGKLIDSKNWTALRDTLSVALPASLCFNLTVYDEMMNQVNEYAISNGALSSQEIAFVNYVCASQSPIFHCYTIYLHLAVAQ